MSALLVIGDESIRRATGPGEALISFNPAPVSIKVLNRRRSLEHGCIFFHQLGLQLPKRRNVINDPDAAPMCSQHEVGLARMNSDIADRHSREIAALVLRPALATVGRDPQAKFGSQKEQIGI